jgi:hypothetical protein
MIPYAPRIKETTGKFFQRNPSGSDCIEPPRSSGLAGLMETISYAGAKPLATLGWAASVCARKKGQTAMAQIANVINNASALA